MSTFGYHTHTLRPEDPLEPAPPAEPEPSRPWWRKPFVLAAEVLAIAAFGALIYILANRPPTFDLLTTPACVNGDYQLTWTVPDWAGSTDAKLISPSVAEPSFEVADQVVTLTLPGGTSGDVRVEFHAEDGQIVTAGANGALTGRCS